MAENEFDVVVVGAGFAGLCCAGTLVEQGARVALVAEGPEVGWNLRPTMVAGNRGIIQHPVWQAAWGGGWWYPLARILNVPVRFEIAPMLDFIVRGREPKKLSFCATAPALFDTFAELSPIPLDPIRDDFQRVLEEGLRMDWRDLMRLSDMPLRQWLEEREVNPAVQALIYMFLGNVFESTPEEGAEHGSVFGFFGVVRSMWCAEAPGLTIVPDPQNGLLVPMAKAIERLDGTVLRAKKVERVLIEGGRAVGLVLRDGTEIRAKAVAIATGTNRVPALLPEMPDEVRTAVDYASNFFYQDVCIFAVLGQPVVTVDHYACYVDESGSSLLFVDPLHALAPWGTQPGKHFISAQTVWTPKEFAEAGGQTAIADLMVDRCEEIFPGFKNATEAMEIQNHAGLWYVPLTHGPKLPRTTKDLPGLWFVGDGSAPIVGLGCDGAAGAGVLGARDILAALGTG